MYAVGFLVKASISGGRSARNGGVDESSVISSSICLYLG